MKTKMLFSQEKHIECGDVLLRPVCAEDAEALLDMYSNESIYRYRPGIKKKSLSLVEKTIKSFQEQMKNKEAMYYSVFEMQPMKRLVALAEVFHIDAKVEQVEIGYTVLPDYQGLGFATLIIGYMTDYLIQKIGFNRVYASVHPDNIASQKALLKNEFTYEGKARQSEFWQGLGFVDVCRYAKLKQDYE
jgi:ribosomal-protein-alanine N-acetyltransferase